MTKWDEGLEIQNRRAQLYEADLNGYSIWLGDFGYVDSALNVNMARVRQWVREQRELFPKRPAVYRHGNGFRFAASTGRLEEFRVFLDSLDVEVPRWHWELIDQLPSFFNGDFDRADSVLRAKPGLESWGFGRKYLDPVRGRIAASHDAFVERVGVNDYPFLQGRAALLLEVMYGARVPSEVRPPFGHELHRIGEYVNYGTRAALVGDTLEANRVLEQLNAMRDSVTSDQFEKSFGPMIALIKAGPARRRADWESVIGLLESWLPMAWEPGYGFNAGDSYLAWWVLADAYAEIADPDSAIELLEAIVGPPRYQINDYVWYGLPYSAAQFRLAQLYTHVGNTREAIHHYTQFLNVFTDPDPEYEWMVQEARAALDSLDASL